MFPPHTAYRTIYQPQKIFYYFSQVSPTLIFPQISCHPEQGRMKTHTPSADPIRNTHRHSQSADIGCDNLRQVADFPFVPRPMAFLQSGQAVTITSAPVASNCPATDFAICTC